MVPQLIWSKSFKGTTRIDWLMPSDGKPGLLHHSSIIRETDAKPSVFSEAE
jgi:hypothetical protein